MILPRAGELLAGTSAHSFSYLLTDPAGMNELRSQLFRAGWHGELARLTDFEILEEVARLLRSGELFLQMETIESHTGAGGGAAPPAEQAAPIVQPPPPKREPAPAKEEDTDPDTLPSNLDAATQAATLKAAAAQGAPFCPT
jgi:hypothetical protein